MRFYEGREPSMERLLVELLQRIFVSPVSVGIEENEPNESNLRVMLQESTDCFQGNP